MGKASTMTNTVERNVTPPFIRGGMLRYAACYGVTQNVTVSGTKLQRNIVTLCYAKCYGGMLRSMLRSLCKAAKATGAFSAPEIGQSAENVTLIM